MNSSIVQRVGSAALGNLEYVGALTIQIRGGTVAALSRALPLPGNRNRWRAALRQMLAVGVQAAPWSASWRSVQDSSWRCRGHRNCGNSGRFKSCHQPGHHRFHQGTGPATDRDRRQRTLRVGVFGRDRQHGGQ